MVRKTRIEKSAGMRLLSKSRDSDGASLTLDCWTETDMDTMETSKCYLISVNGTKTCSMTTFGEYDNNSWSAVNLFSRMLAS